MCNFFSAISDGFGKVLFFKIEDVVKEMSVGNPKNYEWNSHSSISKYYGVEPKDENTYNFWEYDVDKKVLTIDRVGHRKDNELKVKKTIEDYLEGKDLAFIRNFYNNNSGHSNSGHSNSGNSNSGNWNSGHSNSGNCNSGNRNSGNCNSGNSNSGNRNSGNSNRWNRKSGKEKNKHDNKVNIDRRNRKRDRNKR